MTTPANATNLPPGPWTLSWSETFTNNGIGHVYLVDANGKKIAPIWGGKNKEQVAQFILDACNAAMAKVSQ